jgi:hypothetical protein
MIKTLSHLFTPQTSNNYKAKALHISSLSIFILIIMISQILISFVGQNIPGVLGISSSITSEELIGLTNQQRQNHGLPPLEVNAVLIQAALQKAGDMTAKDYWAHTSPDGKTPWSFFKDSDYQYLYAGENLARDFLDSESVIKAWMNSPTHKDNILSNRYQEIGVAVVHETFQGQPTTLVVQMLGTQIGAALPSVGRISQPAEVLLSEIGVQQQVAGFKDKIPILNSFHLTKALSISLTLILLAVIVIDSVIITKKKIVRLSGKGLAHLIFLGILLILLLGIQPGLIL